MDGSSPPISEFTSLIRLLDDDTPAVRQSVHAKLATYGGDVSDYLVASRTKLPQRSIQLLSSLLLPARRAELRRDWTVPSDGARALADDWEHFEALLRQISDFLHDGVTLRQPMSDALDLLAEEADEAGAHDPDSLRSVLFANGRFSGNSRNFHAPENSDLAWVLESGVSNPLGLSLVYLLTARRLAIDVEGCNNPGHFLTRIRIDDRWFLVDCYNQGRIHPLDDILAGETGSHPGVRAILSHPASPGEMLARVLHNLVESFKRLDRPEDASLMRELAATLDP